MRNIACRRWDDFFRTIWIKGGYKIFGINFKGGGRNVRTPKISRRGTNLGDVFQAILLKISRGTNLGDVFQAILLKIKKVF